MRNTLTIALKESRTLLTSPMAYVITAVFVALAGVFFVTSISSAFPEASIRGYVQPATFILVLLAPILTMRVLAEEQKLGTIELLLTSPVRDWEVVVGKFLATFIFYVGMLVISLVFVGMLKWFGDPDLGPVFTGYVGLLLYGGAALSVGLFTSSLTGNQIVAAVVSFGILLFMSVIQQAAASVSGIPATIIKEISIVTHFDDFSRGIIDTRGIIYYLSVIIVFLFFTVRSLETRRWR